MMRNPTGTIVLQQNVDMTIDDATLHHTNTFDINPDLLQAQTHQDLSIWGEYLECTEGLLEYAKTKCIFTIWEFKPNGTPYILKMKDLPENTIYIKETKGKVKKLE
eukprot:14142023-Ditylum_brightwellii.AAC.1